MAIGKTPTPEQIEETTVFLTKLKLLGCTNVTVVYDVEKQRTIVVADGKYVHTDDKIPHEYLEAACAVFTYRK